MPERDDRHIVDRGFLFDPAHQFVVPEDAFLYRVTSPRGVGTVCIRGAKVIEASPIYRHLRGMDFDRMQKDLAAVRGRMELLEDKSKPRMVVGYYDENGQLLSEEVVYDREKAAALAAEIEEQKKKKGSSNG